MSGVEPGWYPDPAAPETQRYWDGEQWLGAPLPVDGPTPTEIPVPEPPAPQASAYPPAPESAQPSILPQYPRVPTSFPPRQSDQPDLFGVGGSSGPGARPGGGGSPAFPPAPGSAAANQTALQAGMPVARLWSRFAARVVDMAALFGLNLLINGYFLIQYQRASEPAVNRFMDAWRAGNPTALSLSSEAQRLILIIMAVSLGLWFAYEVPSTANRGQTLGKRLFGIKVIRMDGQQVRFGQSIRRWFILSFPSLIQGFGWLLFLLNVLWCTWDRPARQCLHDKAAQTIVVVAPKASQGVPANQQGPGTRQDDDQARLD